jgi:hypothetical protein
LNSYLKDGLKEVRAGVLKHLHEFWEVISPEQRVQFLKVYKNALEDKQMVEIFATNIGDFSLLFSPEEVTRTLLPLFVKLWKSR